MQLIVVVLEIRSSLSYNFEKFVKKMSRSSVVIVLAALLAIIQATPMIYKKIDGQKYEPGKVEARLIRLKVNNCQNQNMLTLKVANCHLEN